MSKTWFMTIDNETWKLDGEPMKVQSEAYELSKEFFSGNIPEGASYYLVSLEELLSAQSGPFEEVGEHISLR